MIAINDQFSLLLFLHPDQIEGSAIMDGGAETYNRNARCDDLFDLQPPHYVHIPEIFYNAGKKRTKGYFAYKNNRMQTIFTTVWPFHKMKAVSLSTTSASSLCTLYYAVVDDRAPASITWALESADREDGYLTNCDENPEYTTPSGRGLLLVVVPPTPPLLRSLLTQIAAD